MVDIEKRALGTLEQDALALASFLHRAAARRHRETARRALRHGHQFIENRLRIDFPYHQSPRCSGIVVRKQAVDFRRQRVPVGKIHHPDRPPSDLVFIGRADTTPGVVPILVPFRLASSRSASSSRCSDRISVALSAILRFFRGYRYSLLLQTVDFRHQRMRIDHHAIADDADGALPHDTRRQDAEFVGHTVDDQCVARIMATLKPHHHIGPLRKPVDNFALAPRRPHCEPTTTTLLMPFPANERTQIFQDNAARQAYGL